MTENKIFGQTLLKFVTGLIGYEGLGAANNPP
jgi:hypothetical protein